MNIFSMADIIPLIGLPYPPGGRISYYVSCPCCDDRYKKHLNINLLKNVFRCPRCGVHGGVLDMYSLYTGTPRDQAYNTLKQILNDERRFQMPEKRFPALIQPLEQCPVTDIDTRHMTYSALLDKLSLAPDHLENLMRRGLDQATIDRLGYKTTPVVGQAALVRRLHDDGVYLAGVPGFFIENDGKWTISCSRYNRGILIPIRDIKGRVQGLQLRLDNAEKRKFRWISSAERKDGCKAEAWTHLAGPIRQEMILIEGPMKADIVNALTGQSLLAVPGVNSLEQLTAVLPVLRRYGVKKIMTAFDMDMIVNYNVQSGYKQVLRLLDKFGFIFGTYVWAPKFNGLDDNIWKLYASQQNKQ